MMKITIFLSFFLLAFAKFESPLFHLEQADLPLHHQKEVHHLLNEEDYVQHPSLFHRQSVFKRDQDTKIYQSVAPRKAKTPREWVERGELIKKTPFRGASPNPGPFYKFIPSYVGTVTNENHHLAWSSPCFQNNTLDFSMQSSQTAGLMDITMQLSIKEPINDTCSDFYAFLTVMDYFADEFTAANDFSFTWKNVNTTGVNDIEVNGIRVFRFEEGIVHTLQYLADTAELFLFDKTPQVPEEMAKLNHEFLEEYTDFSLPVRNLTNPNIAFSLNETEIVSGSTMMVLRLDGQDTMQAFGQGSPTSHTVMVQRINGTLYVLESTANTVYWPKNHVQMNEWHDWLELAVNASYNVVYLPLATEVADKYDEDAAADWFFNNAQGAQYGFHNFLFGWIDTPEDNFPTTLSSHLLMIAGAFASPFLEGKVYDMWAPALNMRLGTVNLTTLEVYALADQKNISFTHLITMPENDTWRYADGIQMVCDTFVCEMYKAAGLFENYFNVSNDAFQCTEFDNWDLYSLSFYEQDQSNLPEICQQSDPNLPYCQILGTYQMQLPHFNTYQPFPSMRQTCPGLPPSYSDRYAVVNEC